MTRFAIATSIPVLLLTLSAVGGDPWAYAALVAMTLWVFALDGIEAMQAPARPGAEFPAGTGLSVALGLMHFPLLALAVWMVSGGGAVGLGARIAAFVAFSLFFGQVSNPNAHELIHRANRHLRRLGVAVYATLLYGHHASAHPLVHHVHVATPADPNSARRGESFYRFAWRAWRGEYSAGRVAEDQRRARGGKTGWHPYRIYAAGSLLTFVCAALIGGLAGIAALVALASYTQVQLLMSDYVQHYGLRRRRMADGRTEPCGPQHSWNAPHWYSSALMLNAPRHSDHHLRPRVTYPGLELDPAAMPTLPHPLPAMAVLALWPSMWRRVMDPLVDRWQGAPGDRFAGM